MAAFVKARERSEDIGLSIAESKTLLAAIQHKLVAAQAAKWVERHRCCAACGRRRRGKGRCPVVFRTLFGDVSLASSRLCRCRCQNGEGSASASPLADLLPGHVAPERLYLEARRASLMPYVAVSGLLSAILPLAAGIGAGIRCAGRVDQPVRRARS